MVPVSSLGTAFGRRLRESIFGLCRSCSEACRKGFMEGSWGQRSIVLRRCCDVHAVRGTSGLATTCRMQERRVAPPGLSAEPPARRQPAKNGKMDEFIVSRPADLNDLDQHRGRPTSADCSDLQCLPKQILQLAGRIPKPSAPQGWASLDSSDICVGAFRVWGLIKIMGPLGSVL